MGHDLTKDDRLIVVRQFLLKHAKKMIFSLLLGVVILCAWFYWQSYQKKIAIEAAASWQHINEVLWTDKNKGLLLAEQFASHNKNNYGVLMSLQLAYYAVEEKNYLKAEQQLKQALEQTRDNNLHAQVLLRLARVQLQQKKYEEVFKTLDSFTEGTWQASALEVRGDALLQQGNNQGARDAYNDALKTASSEELQAILRMKLDDLS